MVRLILPFIIVSAIRVGFGKGEKSEHLSQTRYSMHAQASLSQVSAYICNSPLNLKGGTIHSAWEIIWSEQLLGEGLVKDATVFQKVFSRNKGCFGQSHYYPFCVAFIVPFQILCYEVSSNILL